MERVPAIPARDDVNPKHIDSTRKLSLNFIQHGLQSHDWKGKIKHHMTASKPFSLKSSIIISKWVDRARRKGLLKPRHKIDHIYGCSHPEQRLKPKPQAP